MVLKIIVTEIFKNQNNLKPCFLDFIEMRNINITQKYLPVSKNSPIISSVCMCVCACVTYMQNYSKRKITISTLTLNSPKAG